MTQVFTKKHKKSSCLALLLLFLALTAPSFAQEPSKELSGTSNHLLNINKKSEMLGLPVGIFGVYHQRQPAHLKAKNDAQLQELLDSLAFYVRPFAEPRLERLFKSFKVKDIPSKNCHGHQKAMAFARPNEECRPGRMDETSK